MKNHEQKLNHQLEHLEAVARIKTVKKLNLLAEASKMDREINLVVDEINQIRNERGEI